jgi:hypothetical protein
LNDIRQTNSDTTDDAISQATNGAHNESI